MLRWVGDHSGEVAAVGGFLVVLGEKVRAIFRSRRKPTPNEVWLYGPDGLTVIARVEVPKDKLRRSSGGDGGLGSSGRNEG